MNAQTRLVLGIVGGFVIGALFVGSAVAIPRLVGAMHSGARSAYSMMTGEARSNGYDRAFIDEVNRFMDSYRSSDGSVDIGRMQYDLARSESASGASCGSAGRSGRSSDDGQGYGSEYGTGSGNGPGSGYGYGTGMMGWGY